MRPCSSLFVCLSLAALGCSGSTGSTNQRGGLPHTARQSKPGKESAVQAKPLAAHRFAEVRDVIGPYVGRDGDVALAAWAEASGSGRTLLVAPIDAAGLPGKPVRLGNVAPELDLVLISVHSLMSLDRKTMTDRVLRAMSHPSVDILAHPTGRQINKREAFAMDVEAVLEARGSESQLA